MAQLPLIRQNQAGNAHIDGATQDSEPTFRAEYIYIYINKHIKSTKPSQLTHHWVYTFAYEALVEAGAAVLCGSTFGAGTLPVLPEAMRPWTGAVKLKEEGNLGDFHRDYKVLK